MRREIEKPKPENGEERRNYLKKSNETESLGANIHESRTSYARTARIASYWAGRREPRDVLIHLLIRSVRAALTPNARSIGAVALCHNKTFSNYERLYLLICFALHYTTAPPLHTALPR